MLTPLASYGAVLLLATAAEGTAVTASPVGDPQTTNVGQGGSVIAAAMARAQELWGQGDLAGCAAALHRVLKQDPDHLDALWALAGLESERGDSRQAAAHLKAILALDPNDDDARMALIRALRAHDDHAMARVAEEDLRLRHPTLEFADSITTDSGAQDSDSGWHPLGRLSAGAGWDSNVSLGSGATVQTADQAAAVADMGVAVGVMHSNLDQHNLSLTVLGLMSVRTALSDRETSAAYMPSSVGAATTLRRPIAGLVGGIDLRYRELFADAFSGGRVEGQLSPSLFASWKAHPQHNLRLLVGFDNRRSAAALNIMTPKVSLRDTFDVGQMHFLAELGGRRALLTGDASSPTALEARQTFDEISAIGLGEIPVVPNLVAFALVSGHGRRFDSGLQESEYGAQLGARFEFGDLELHAELGFQKRLSGRLRSYDRQQMSLGVRYWIP